mmetsp:Transcript_104961/g.182442  ORF Transcript_104961/g.182442 Transcript_104961/m.182442 type:complete len:292 (-) Transcript_104961:112-987(-)
MGVCGGKCSTNRDCLSGDGYEETTGVLGIEESTRRLEGKVAIVTGSSKGIGKAIAIRFAKEGAKVAVNYMSDPKGGEDTVAKCKEVGGEGCAICVQADLGKVADCKKLVAETVKAFGAVSVLVNNAGKEIHDDVWDVKEKDYDRVLDINMKGVFFCTQAVVQEMVREKRKGAIVNISSVHEDLPFPGFSPYCMSKGGMKMFTRNLSIELAPNGISINNIAPGAIETPINASVLKEPAKLAALLENIPLQRLGQPSDISSCAVYLASDEASYCTGSTIVVDGGLTWNYVENH